MSFENPSFEEIKSEVKIVKETAGEDPKAESKDAKNEEMSQKEQIDAVALNNKIVNMPSEKDRNEAIANLSQAEISAVAKNIAEAKDVRQMLDYLGNFENKPEIVSSPEITEALKKNLSEGGLHLYDVDRISDLSSISGEIFKDTTVQKGIENSIKRFISYQSPSDLKSAFEVIDRVVEKANISNEGLRIIADALKGNTDQYRSFVEHFGVRKLYPELKK